jgi:signal transduction histidine kinase
VGLFITLSIFGVFAFYTMYEIRGLEDFQSNVVQANRRASLQLLRIQNNAYQLAVSLRDMTVPESRYPVYYWRGPFSDFRGDMEEAVRLEEEYAVRTAGGDEKRQQLRFVLEDFWETAEQAFDLADAGHEETARYLIRSQMEEKCEVMARLVGQLLQMNDQAQAEAAEQVSQVYLKVQRNILLVIGVFFLVALGTGLYTLQANRKTFEQLQRLAEKLQMQNRQLEALYDAIHVVSQEQETRKVLQDASEQLCRALELERVAFLRSAPEGGRFFCEVSSGFGDADLELDRLEKTLRDSPPPTDVAGPFPLAVRAADSPGGEGTAPVRYLAIPLRLGASLIGIFAIRLEREETLGEEDLKLASKIVEATVGPLKNARLLERLTVQSEQLRKLSWKLIEVQEETLRQVARDLHDEFGQILTAIGVMLNRAGQKGLAPESPFVAEVGRVKKIVEETLRSVRDSSQMFRPAVLDDFGLEQTLNWFIEQFSQQTGIRVHFERQLIDGFFPGEDAVHLYRIVQEALNNVARHSKAREAWVRLKETDAALELEIRDEGAGFRLDGEMDRAAGEGIGLMGMRERAEHLNGTLTITSAPHRGTVVRVRIPLKRPAAEKVG